MSCYQWRSGTDLKWVGKVRAGSVGLACELVCLDWFVASTSIRGLVLTVVPLSLPESTNARCDMISAAVGLYGNLNVQNLKVVLSSCYHGFRAVTWSVSFCQKTQQWEAIYTDKIPIGKKRTASSVTHSMLAPGWQHYSTSVCDYNTLPNLKDIVLKIVATPANLSRVRFKKTTSVYRIIPQWRGTFVMFPSMIF